VPYIRCAECGVTSFSVAGWSHVDHCGACGRQLPRASLANVVSRRLTPRGRLDQSQIERSSHGPARATP
jgi:hypothetical protein